MHQWKEVTLDEIADLTVGFVGKTATHYVGEGIRFLRSMNVEPFRINYNDPKFIDQEFHNKIKKSELNSGDVVIVRTGKPGACSVIPQKLGKWNCADLVVVKPNHECVNSTYLAAFINLAYGVINAHLVGAVQQHFNVGVAKKLKIKLPPMDLQNKIGYFIDNINDRIELNEKINKNLLQQLHVLYLRLFCDSAMDTPLGDVVATTSGGTPSRKHDEYYSDSSICWVKSKELLGNYIHETEEHINDLAIKKSSAKLLPEHSVLIAMYGATVGAYGVISKPMTCNQAVCALLCNENYPYTYLFQIAYESQQKFINLAVGSAQQNISQVLIKQLNLHSDLDIIQKFHVLALPMHKEIESLQAENMRLSALRDNLLPKLMSGELDVSNIDL